MREGILDDVKTSEPHTFGSLLIHTQPKDARVYLNKRLIGSASPIRIERQGTEHDYVLTVIRKGYASYTRMFNIQAGEEMFIDVKLDPVQN